MFVKITHEHKCKRMATAPAMGENRDWWVGELLEHIPEYPVEKFCLHLKTPYKDVTFLCNEADFQQLQILGRCVTGVLNDSWMETMVNWAKTHPKNFE